MAVLWDGLFREPRLIPLVTARLLVVSLARLLGFKATVDLERKGWE